MSCRQRWDQTDENRCREDDDIKNNTRQIISLEWPQLVLLREAVLSYCGPS